MNPQVRLLNIHAGWLDESDTDHGGREEKEEVMIVQNEDCDKGKGWESSVRHTVEPVQHQKTPPEAAAQNRNVKLNHIFSLEKTEE